MELVRLERAIPRNPYEKARNFLVVVQELGHSAIFTGSTKDGILNEASKAPKGTNHEYLSLSVIIVSGLIR